MVVLHRLLQLIYYYVYMCVVYTHAGVFKWISTLYNIVQAFLQVKWASNEIPEWLITAHTCAKVLRVGASYLAGWYFRVHRCLIPLMMFLPNSLQSTSELLLGLRRIANKEEVSRSVPTWLFYILWQRSLVSSAIWSYTLVLVSTRRMAKAHIVWGLWNPHPAPPKEVTHRTQRFLYNESWLWVIAIWHFEL